MRHVFLCLALVACGDDDDDVSIDAATVDVAGGDTIDAGDLPECPTTRIGSCLKEGGRCAEVLADPSFEEGVAANCTADPGSTWRSGVACELEAAVGSCLLAAPGACQTFFYSPPYDGETAAAECGQSGGQYSPL